MWLTHIYDQYIILKRKDAKFPTYILQDYVIEVKYFQNKFSQYFQQS